MWILFSLTAAFLWSIVNVIDKFALSKLVKKPLTPTIVLGAVSLAAAIVVVIFRGVSVIGGKDLLLALSAGALYILMTVFYFKALFTEEVSRAIPLFYLCPLFILIFAWLFLGESLSSFKIIGVIMLIIGAMLISSHDAFKPKFSSAFLWMTLSALVMAGNQLIYKYLLNHMDFWSVFVYIRAGIVLATIPIMYYYLSDLKQSTKTHGLKVVGIISLSEIINLAGSIIITFGVAAGSVTLVNALSSVQPFFVLILMILLSLFLPKILKEEISKISLTQKLVAIAAMFIGIIYIG